jgi:putative transposase
MRPARPFRLLRLTCTAFLSHFTLSFADHAKESLAPSAATQQLSQFVSPSIRAWAKTQVGATEREPDRGGSFLADHVHMLISIPPKYAVSQVVGFIKGKSAIHLARVYGERKRNFVGQHFWARGYFVSTVGRDQELIREYIKKQEAEEEQLNLWR